MVRSDDVDEDKNKGQQNANDEEHENNGKKENIWKVKNSDGKDSFNEYFGIAGFNDNSDNDDG